MLVDRLWATYDWPERNLPMKGMTLKKLLTYPVQSKYVCDLKRTWKQPPRAWDYGRIRYFYEQLLSGHVLDPIEVDNECYGDRIYPVPIVNDGHHRLAASHLAKARFIHATYGGRVDLCRYLTGRRSTRPSS
jgi:hypothetical protein